MGVIFLLQYTGSDSTQHFLLSTILRVSIMIKTQSRCHFCGIIILLHLEYDSFQKHTSELESVSIPHYQFNPHSRTRLQPDIYSSTAFVTNVQIKPTLKENMHSNMNINA